MSATPPPAARHHPPASGDAAAGDLRARLAHVAGLSADVIDALGQGLSLAQADHMIENVVAIHALPLAVAIDFTINGRDVLLPMVSDDATIAAACSDIARLVRVSGGFTTGSTEPIMIGQIQVLDVPDMSVACQRLAQSSQAMLDWLNTRNPATISTHARAIGLEIRELSLPNLESRSASTLCVESRISNLQSLPPDLLVLHLLYDCGDAMGANLINTACEALVPQIEMLTGGRVNLRILSNLSDRRRAWSRCQIPATALAYRADRSHPTPAHTIQERVSRASQLAENDAAIAAFYNKRVMDAVDAVVLATGNDWRAVEAGAHAYAARHGTYTSLVSWRATPGGDLRGEIELPLAIGIVGGATRVHPLAKVCLKLLDVGSARELAEVIACAGLAMSLAAIITELA